MPPSAPADEFEPPRGSVLLTEGRLVREPLRLALRAPALVRARAHVRPRPVMVLPGFGSSDAATAPLRAYLRWLGHDVRGWGLGSNHGGVEALVGPVTDRVARFASRAGEPVHLVGWSLGGVLAREVARDHADLVAQVITYGTPVVGGPKHTRARGAYEVAEVERIAAIVDERNRTAIRVPVTAIYSRRDGVVAWRACLDTFSPDVTHVEVTSSHVGMGVDPDVWIAVADRLAEF